MTSDGVIPRPEDRQPRHYTQTGCMDAGDGHIIFGAEGPRVIVMCDRGDIVLSHHDQDTFARHLFRAMDAAAITLDAAEVPY